MRGFQLQLCDGDFYSLEMQWRQREMADKYILFEQIHQVGYFVKEPLGLLKSGEVG